MTLEQLTNKRLLFVAIVFWFIFGYMTCNYVNMLRGHYFNVALPFESDIPFIPIFILGYIGVYLAIVLIYAVIDDYGLFKKGMVFFFIISTVHFIFFLLLPVKMVRPDLTHAVSAMDILTKYYYVIDNPVNCFPSLHVSYPLAGTLILWNYKRVWGIVMAVNTFIVAVSVVLVKQHYIMDVVGAVVVTGGVFILLQRSAPVLSRPRPEGR